MVFRSFLVTRQITSSSHLFLSLLSCLMLLFALVAPSAVAVPTTAQVAERLKQVELDDELSEATKNDLLEKLNHIKSLLNEADRYQLAEQRYSSAAQSAPEQTHIIANDIKRLERNHGQLSSAKLEDATAVDIEAQLLRAINNQSNLLNEVNQVEFQITKNQGRPQAILEELGSLAARQGKLDSVVSGLESEGPLDQTKVVNRWLLEAENLALTQQQEALEQELLTHQARMELLQTKLTFLELQHQKVNTKVKLLQDALSSQRVETAEKAQESITLQEQQLGDQHKSIQKLAALNTNLSETISSTTKHLRQVEAAITELSRKTFELGEQYRSTQQKLEIAGLSQALGQVLLEERRSLPNPRNLPAGRLSNRDIIAEAGLNQIQHEEERRRLRNIDEYVDKLTQNLSKSVAKRIQAELLNLADQRRELLTRAVEVEQNYVRSLGELDIALRQYRKKTEIFDEFLTERLLWVRSSPPINLVMLEHTIEQITELLSPDLIAGLLTDLKNFAQTKVLTWFLIFALLIVAFKSSFFHRELSRLGEPLKRLSTDSIRYTLRTLLLTIIYASSWPLIIYVIGSKLNATPESGSTTQALANALTISAPVFLFINFLRKSFVTDGLAAAHFKWPPHSVKIVYRDLGRFQYWFMPLLVLCIFVHTYDFITSTGALAHLSISLTVLVFAYCSLRLVRNRNGFLNIHQSRSNGPPSILMRRYLIGLVVVIPCLMVVAVLTGYLYAVNTLCLHLQQSMMLAVCLLFLHQLVLRWLVLTQRKIAYRKAIEKRQQAKLRKSGEQDNNISPEGISEAPEEPSVNLDALSKGSRELLNTLLVIVGAISLWFIWSEVLPAFGILDEVSIWQYTDLIGSEEQKVPVTLFDLGLAIFIVVVTVLAAKRVPALLEFILLERIQFAAGGLYAMRTLSGYLIVAAGFLTALSTLGASWSQIQWLAAALSVGIGFGLQEIVANFISGLIILFERPIRVGDVVTVGDTDGVVTKIKIRATTIRNWDQKELLVPNKEFITNRLLNWTLSDQTTRLLIPVGIAYGADARKAMQIIEEAAKMNTNVIEDPAPSVTFESFGDNALVLYLRAFISSLDVRLTTITELHLDIYERMNAAGIVIAFPQRDVHLDTTQPLEIRVLQTGDTTTPLRSQ